MYYLNNSHDLMKKLCRLFYQLPCSRLEKFSSKVGGKLFPQMFVSWSFSLCIKEFTNNSPNYPFPTYLAWVCTVQNLADKAMQSPHGLVDPSWGIKLIKWMPIKRGRSLTSRCNKPSHSWLLVPRFLMQYTPCCSLIEVFKLATTIRYFQSSEKWFLCKLNHPQQH